MRTSTATTTALLAVVLLLPTGTTAQEPELATEVEDPVGDLLDGYERPADGPAYADATGLRVEAIGDELVATFTLAGELPEDADQLAALSFTLDLGELDTRRDRASVRVELGGDQLAAFDAVVGQYLMGELVSRTTVEGGSAEWSDRQVVLRLPLGSYGPAEELEFRGLVSFDPSLDPETLRSVFEADDGLAAFPEWQHTWKSDLREDRVPQHGSIWLELGPPGPAASDVAAGLAATSGSHLDAVGFKAVERQVERLWRDHGQSLRPVYDWTGTYRISRKEHRDLMQSMRTGSDDGRIDASVDLAASLLFAYDQLHGRDVKADLADAAEAVRSYGVLRAGKDDPERAMRRFDRQLRKAVSGFPVWLEETA
jgi:hypothetical protein